MNAIVRAFPIAVLVVLAAGCSDERSGPGAPTAAKGQAHASERAASVSPPPGNTGTIEARVTYAGAPLVETIKINKDVKVCGREATIERIVVGDDHGLANAVVSVAGFEGPAATPDRPQLDQRGCQFRPHVIAMQPGDVEVVNSDGVLHNLHTYSDRDEQVNRAQPKFKKVMTVSFDKPDIVKATCDVHSWMRAWIVVLATPYFGVTDTHGVTRLAGVPAGTHTVEVWQEELGRRSQDVTVTPGQTTSVVFEFPKR
jgi:plastocyanin